MCHSFLISLFEKYIYIYQEFINQLYIIKLSYSFLSKFFVKILGGFAKKLTQFMFIFSFYSFNKFFKNYLPQIYHFFELKDLSVRFFFTYFIFFFSQYGELNNSFFRILVFYNMEALWYYVYYYCKLLLYFRLTGFIE